MKDFIFIPIDVFWRTNLTSGEKIFLGFLMTNKKDGYCSGTNQYFSENLCMSISTISKYIEKLEVIKLIETLYIEENGNIVRHIYIKI